MACGTGIRGAVTMWWERAGYLFVVLVIMASWVYWGRDRKQIKRLRVQLAMAIAEAKFFQDVAGTRIVVTYNGVAMVEGTFATLHLIGKYSGPGWAESVLTPPDTIIQYRIEVPTDGK